ncbi:MAG: group 1 truncated hemoglobin [Rhodanobacteraceae bacterium]
MNGSIRFLLALCMVSAAGCAGTTRAPESAPPPTAASAAPRGDSLYRALGGREGIGKVVDASLVEIHGDTRIAFFFEKTDLADLRRLLVEQLCAATGGPCTYSGRTMEESHSGLNITDADFDAFVEDLVRAMHKERVPKNLQKQLLGLLAPMRPEVVGQ